MKSPRVVWKSFTDFLVTNSIDELTIQAAFVCIADWLRMNLKSFPKEIIERYGFNKFISINPQEYPVNTSDELIFLSKRLEKINPSSLDSVAMIIRDILWDLISYKSDLMCPNCKDDCLRILFDEKINTLVLSCDLCGWSQKESGEEWMGNNKLVPAKTINISSVDTVLRIKKF